MSNAANENELILRRLNDPFPPDLQLLGINFQYPIMGLILLAGLGGIALFYWWEHKSLGFWTYYTALLRLISVVLFGAAVAFPRAEITQLQSFGENVAWY